MIDWLIGKTIGWVFGLLIFALIWPVYKSGFLVRQGIAYKKTLRQVDEQIAKSVSEGNSAERAPEYFKLKNKSTLLIALPLTGIAALFVILMVYTSWKVALGEAAIAGVGFVNVE